jgi:hypothetical protein
MFWLAGYAIRMLSEWVLKDTQFIYKQWVPSSILSVCLGLILAYFSKDAEGGVTRFIFACGGFLSLYFFNLLHKLQKLEDPKK